MEVLFVMVKDHQVIGVTEIKTDPFFFLDPVIKIGQVEIGKVLAEIVANRQPGSAINDLVEQPKQVIVFELPPEQLLQDRMIN